MSGPSAVLTIAPSEKENPRSIPKSFRTSTMLSTATAINLTYPDGSVPRPPDEPYVKDPPMHLQSPSRAPCWYGQRSGHHRRPECDYHASHAAVMTTSSVVDHADACHALGQGLLLDADAADDCTCLVNEVSNHEQHNADDDDDEEDLPCRVTQLGSPATMVRPDDDGPLPFSR